MSSYPSHMIEHIIVVLVIAPLVGGRHNCLASVGPMSTVGFFALRSSCRSFTSLLSGAGSCSIPKVTTSNWRHFFVVGVWFWIPVYGSGRTLGDQQRITYTVLALPVIATTVWCCGPRPLPRCRASA